LDKSTQSKERGMTLDLGFSCFFVDLPPQFRESYPHKDQLQVTLVDCPGHASLIRTIIGGAQIIDMVLLVVDAQKGWQAQTTECLVLAELTSPHLVVALNKADLLVSGVEDDDSEREARIQRAKRRVRERLSSTRFADAPIVAERRSPPSRCLRWRSRQHRRHLQRRRRRQQRTRHSCR
jgi:selenocysteine-specific elongation factor